ncbi:MAG TPA: alpha/beta hydrolase [Thermoanaerobaculia bacterium]|nr:alpha/beta hydrolase [Thermoanaerobaculia bacterium]
MSQEPEQEPMARKRVLYQPPGLGQVRTRRDVEFAAEEGGELRLDLYTPAGAAPGARFPAVVLVAGYPDPGFERVMGCKFKEMGSVVSWAELIAGSGMAAIAYTNREPAADGLTLLRHLRQNAAELGLDENRIGLWAGSGNAPLALWLLMQAPALGCAALLYPFTLDAAGAPEGSHHVADAAKTWRFAHPAEGRAAGDLPPEVPLFLARAGRDETPHLNESLDRFVVGALAANLPLTLVNHPEAPHAFDLVDDGETSRQVINQVLAFLRQHLLGS